MEMRSISKIKKYVSGLITLLEYSSLYNIRVKDICEICCTDRQNFYYYFNDKYELASWVLRLDYMESLQKFNDRYSPEQLAYLLEKMWAKRKLYIDLLSDNSQNSLMEYLKEERNKLYSTLFRDYYGISVNDDEYDLVIAFAFNGAIQSIKSWLKGEFVMTPKKHADMIFDMIPLSKTSTKTDTVKKQYSNNSNLMYKADLHRNI